MKTSNTAKKETSSTESPIKIETAKAVLKNIKLVKPQVTTTEKSRGPRDCFPLG